MLSKNGGHTLLPPTVGVTGKAYQWVQWSEYPPTIDQPEDIGLYPVKKKTEVKPRSTVNDWTGGTTLTDLLRIEIYPRLSLDRAFSWHGHDFKQHGSKLKGNCPWHDSQSGTAFYTEIKDGSPVWRCPACEIGGSVIEYRHRLAGGNGSPRGSEFVELVKELAAEVGVVVPDFKPYTTNDNHQNSGGSKGDKGSKVALPPGFDSLTLEQVTEKIDELIAQGATGSYLTGQLNRLSAASQIYTHELRTLYYERLAESDLEIDRGDNQAQVENLLNLGDQSLDLQDYLPEALATPLKLWCSWLSIRPESAFTALLTGVSSLHKVGTKLVIHRNQRFRVPPIIFSALVSDSGQKKSPILDNIILDPLNELRQEKIDAHKAAMEEYEAAVELWEKSGKKGKKPEEPKDPTLYYLTNATGEAIPVQASKAPDKALLALIDELSGLFSSANSYRGGRGSDKQDILSYFDGRGQTVLRASGIKVDLRNINLSIFGTIQPEVLKNHIADCSDPDGQWARFLFINQPLVAATLSDDDGQFVQIHDRIAGFYRQIDQLPEMEYRLSRKAFKRYQRIYNQLEKLRVTHPRPGMRAVYSKMEGYIGRLALNLHVLWELAAGKSCPSEEIPLVIMEMAIALAKFYIGQVKLVHSFSDEEGLAPGIVKLIDLSKRLDTNGKDGWIKAQQYRELFAVKKRPSAQQARDCMIEAVKQGFGRTRNAGNRLEYHWRCDNNNDDNSPPPPKDELGNLGKVREDLGKDVPYAENPEKQRFEDNLGNLGKGVSNSFLREEVVDQNNEVDTESSLEGGYLPEASLNTPQNCSDVITEGNTDLGNNVGTPFPNPFLSSLNDVATQIDEGDSESSLEGGYLPEASLNTPQDCCEADTQSNTDLGNTLGNAFPNPSLNSLSNDEEPEQLDQPMPSEQNDSTLVDQEVDEATINELRECLLHCTSMSMVCLVLNALSNYPSAKTEACKGLPPQKQQQKKEWEAELDELKASFKVGDHVYWSKCPAPCEQFAPFEITAIDGDYANLDLFEKPVLLTELRKP
ncbi:DUF3987 domain-containing protein [Microcoleus sp. FACHB-SPT15]|nr:DUF3987 domain-containing protein [Microcoleus sp. FACHB-SPT15]